VITDGTYDNQRTLRRELYRDGKVVRWESAESLAQRRALPGFFKIPRFGELIDVPRPTRKRCLSCGALEENGGIPCDH
jgi:hypothetical protein